MMRKWGSRVFPVLLLPPALLLASIHAFGGHADRSQVTAPTIPPSVVGQVITVVSTTELDRHICHLQDDDALGYCNTRGSRYSLNPAGLQEAAGYIAQRFHEHGLLVITQTFTPSAMAPGQGSTTVLTNVIGTLQGVAPLQERGVVIVSAHYDSTANGASSGGPAPGADDNASGVAAVLETARLLSRHRFWHTVRFVAFAGEEQGLYGSQHYAAVAHVNGENIVGVVNADMIAYENDGAPRLEIHSGPDPRNTAIAHTLAQTIEDFALNLQPQVVLNVPIRASDHASFWDQGFPAVLVIEDTELTGPTHDFNPHYHTVEDTLDKLDRTYFTDMVRAIAGSLARLAQPMGPDLNMIQQGPRVVMPGQAVTFTLAYSNAGPEPAAGVILTDTLSHGLTYESDSSGYARAFDVAGQVIWDLGELEAGTGGTFVLTATVSLGLQAGAMVSSRATIASSHLDADGVDNVSMVEATVGRRWRYFLPAVVVG